MQLADRDDGSGDHHPARPGRTGRSDLRCRDRRTAPVPARVVCGGRLSYYVGSVTWLSDEPCDPDELREAAGEARAAFEAFQVAAGGGPEIGDPAPEELAYAIAQAVALPLPDRQALLDTDNPLARLRLLVRLLRREAVLFGGLRLAPAERSSFGSPSQN